MPAPQKRRSKDIGKLKGTRSPSLKRKRDVSAEAEEPTSPPIPLRGRTARARLNTLVAAVGFESSVASKDEAVSLDTFETVTQQSNRTSGPTKAARKTGAENLTNVEADIAAKTSQKKVKEPLDYENKKSASEDGQEKTPKKCKTKVRVPIDSDEDSVGEVVEKVSPRKRKTKTEAPAGTDNDESPGEILEKKPPRRRKTKEEIEAEAMPLAARTTGLRMFVGAHVSMAKGVENAVTNIVHVGGNAFALFLQSQRKWENPPLLDKNRDAFIEACKEHKYDAKSHILPHGSYLVNLAQEEKEKAKQAYNAFVGDLHRCEALGIKYYNFHPGAASMSPRAEAINRIANQLNQALAETKTVVPVLENMAGSGSVIGGNFSDHRDIIAKIKPEFKSRIGVCIDTCHAFAAGYDLRTPDSFKKVLKEFDEVVGMKYLKAMHLNDSKAPFDSNRDLHQNIGLGFLGLRAFHNVMNEPRLQNMPLILETPCDVPDPKDPTGKKMTDDKNIWAREIKLLESLIGMDPKCAEFKSLEKELSDRGTEERVKMQKQFDEKNEKAKKKLAKEREKGQRSLMDMIGKSKKKGDKSPILSDDQEMLDDQELVG